MDKETANQNLIFGGQARLSAELGAGEVFQIVTWVSFENQKITDVSCSPCLPLAEKFFKQLLIKKNLEEDIESILKSLQTRYHHRGKNAVLTALKEMHRQYMDYRHGKGSEPSGKLERFSF